MQEYRATDIAAQVRRLIDNQNDRPEIVQLGHPALRNPAQTFDGQVDDDELEALLAIMRQAMHDAPGVGLAAPQLGILLRIAVLEDVVPVPDEVAQMRARNALPYFAMVNPEYTPTGPEKASFFEGCLSFTGWQAVVERQLTVDAHYCDPSGTRITRQFSGWSARIVQHETDHLNGVIYIDRANTRSLVSNAEYVKRWAQPGIELAQRTLGF